MMKTRNRAKVSETTTCGAQIVGSIGDLLIQIFVHLPLKPLFRFKLVSKHWNSIISDPRFQLSMRKQEQKNPAIGLIFQSIYCRKGDPFLVETRLVSFYRSSNPLPPQKIVLPDQTLIIFHSCNGLLVLTSTAKKFYYVYNPTTKQKSTPLLKDVIIKSRERDRVAGMCLAFDPSKSPHYKVVCVWELTDYKYQFEVYSSETGSWETRGRYNGYVDFENGVYWNGAIHWFSFHGKSVYFNPDHDEMPRVMPAAPPVPHYNWTRYFFGESCDHLHFAFVGGDHRLTNEIYVYEMRRDYSEWFLMYSVIVISKYLNTVSELCSVVHGNKDEDFFLVLVTNKREIIRYNLFHNTFQTIHDKDDKDFDFIRYKTRHSCQYIESPCSV